MRVRESVRACGRLPVRFGAEIDNPDVLHINAGCVQGDRIKLVVD